MDTFPLPISVRPTLVSFLLILKPPSCAVGKVDFDVAILIVVSAT
jgi:hypothetical protein